MSPVVQRVPAFALECEFLGDFKALAAARPGLKVVLYVRVSRRWQHSKRSLLAQIRRLRAQVLAAGAVIVTRIYWDIGSGYSRDLKERRLAAMAAKRFGAVLVAETANRLLRSHAYQHTKPWILPGRAEWEALRDACFGVTLATVISPGTHWRDVHSLQVERGYKQPCAAGAMKQRKAQMLAKVLWLKKWDCSLDLIEQETGVNRSTARDWISSSVKGVR